MCYKVQVKFSCQTCGAGSDDLPVRPKRDGESWAWWARHVVGNAVIQAHAMVNLLCSANPTFELWAPREAGITAADVEEMKGVGGTQF